MLGFPTDDGLMGDLFGVKPEDRDAWNNIGATGITSQMRAAYIEEQRGTMSKKTETTTTTVTRTQSHNVEPEDEVDSPTYGF